MQKLLKYFPVSVCAVFFCLQTPDCQAQKGKTKHKSTVSHQKVSSLNNSTVPPSPSDKPWLNPPKNNIKKDTSVNRRFACRTSTELRQSLIAYAATFLGTPYKISGRDAKGFDCSGFVSYIFRQFDMELYSSAFYMEKQGKAIKTEQAQPGDVIFFTGTSAKNRDSGHVGIVVSQPGKTLKFIHASSGKEYCVKYDTLTSPYYVHRFLEVKRMIE
jgi:cell wall-associated NlpC family hydrolase